MLNTAAVLLLSAAVVFADLIQLSSLNVNKNTVTVSGISSGGAMAVQMHVAYSSVFKGCGVFAAPGPFWCAQGTLMQALMCMNAPKLEDVQLSVSKAQDYEEAGKVDGLGYLSKSRVWLFSGTTDWTVQQGSVKHLEEFYKVFMKEGINSTYNVPANHAWITDHEGDTSCGTLASPYINNCYFDGAGMVLNYLLFDAQKIKPVSRTQAKGSNLYHFDQSPFGSAAQGMHQMGALYVPDACKNKTSQCHLHVALHGCDQNSDAVGEKFFTGTGLNEWAESNRIVVLYPQAMAYGGPLMNPKGCWDWWGFTGEDYANKQGVQVDAVIKMVQKLM